jgi:hypothetical protein
MIITSHMQNIIQIYPCLLKLSHKQESVTDGRTTTITISPHRYCGGIIIEDISIGLWILVYYIHPKAVSSLIATLKYW